MSLRFCDSFDHYQTADFSTKWTLDGGCSISTGRHGNGFTNSELTKTLDYQDTWTIGIAIKGVSVLAGATGLITLFSLNTSGALQQLVSVRKNQDNTLSVTTPAVVIGSNTPAYDWSGFHYIELKSNFSGSGTATVMATCTLRVNSETLVIGSGATNVTGAVLLQGPKANALRVSVGNSGWGDDLYITDGNGGVNTGFMGDVTISVVRPNGDNTVQWTAVGSSTATHYVDVNDTNPDGDTSYVASTATGSMELYDWQDIAAFSGTIKGVQYLIYARKDDEGARVVNLLEGTTGTHTLTNVLTSSADIYLNDNYDYHHIALDTSPTTGSGWTVTDFNADRFGFKVGTNT